MPFSPLQGQPHYVLTTVGRGVFAGAVAAALDPLEHRVPGALVYAKGVSTRGRISRLNKLTDRAKETLLTDASGVTFEIHVPLNGAWLVTDALDEIGIRYVSVATPECAILNPYNDADALAWEARGRIIVESLTDAGRLRPQVQEMLASYQYGMVGFGSIRPWLFERISPGGGKSVIALALAAMSQAKGQGIGRITTLVVGPAKCRSVWWGQAQRFTTLQPWRLLPDGGGESLCDFTARLDAEDALGIAIVGCESLPDHLTTVLGDDEHDVLRPSTIIFDELCSDAMAGRSGRWERTGEADGSIVYKPKLTAGGKRRRAVSSEDEDDAESDTPRVSRAYALMAVSRLPGVHRRIALDGSPLYEGKTRRLFNPFDIIWPAGFGFGNLAFKIRYAGARHNGFGYEDGGATHLDELAMRSSFFVVDVPYAVSHGSLPKTRVEVVRIARDELGPTAKGARTELKALMAEARSGKVKRAKLIELRLAHAAVRKHDRAISDVCDTLKAGGKAVLFTARHADCEKLAEAAEIALVKLTKGDAALAAEPWMLWAHGDSHTEAQRAGMCAKFHDASGPGLLIGTGQAFGTSFDGLQVADFAGVCMLTPRLGELSQWKGRFDRMDDTAAAVATLVRIYLAEESVDDDIVRQLGRQFPIIKAMFDIGDLGDLEEKLTGLDAVSIEAAVDEMMEKL